MEPGIQIKHGATRPTVPFRITQGKRKAVDLQGADIWLRLRSISPADQTVYGGLCSNLDDGTDAQKGRGEFDPTHVVSAPVGFYYAEFKIVYSPGMSNETIAFVPNNGRGFEIVEILASYG